MPRRARKKSSTGIYHVIFRGINRQRIFEDDQDYEKLLETLKHYKEKSGYEIYDPLLHHHLQELPLRIRLHR
jgi:putative transposase